MEKHLTGKNSRVQILKGTVVSSRDHCTIVLVERLVKHPKYGKYIQHRKKYKVADKSENRQIGEVISFIPCPPVSKGKRFKISG